MPCYQNVGYQDVLLPKCLLPKCPITEMSSYRNVLLPKCHVTEMSCYRNVSYQNVHYQSVLYRNVWIPFPPGGWVNKRSLTLLVVEPFCSLECTHWLLKVHTLHFLGSHILTPFSCTGEGESIRPSVILLHLFLSHLSTEFLSLDQWQSLHYRLVHLYGDTDGLHRCDGSMACSTHNANTYSYGTGKSWWCKGKLQ